MQRVHPFEYKTNVIIEDAELALEVKRLKLLQYFVELVTIDKQQFAILTKPSFRKIVCEQIEELEIAGIGINLNDKNLPQIKEHIGVTAKKIREIKK